MVGLWSLLCENADYLIWKEGASETIWPDCLTLGTVKWDPERPDALLEVTQRVGVTAGTPHAASGSRSSLRPPAPLAAGWLHSPLLGSCWPSARRSLDVQPHSTWSPQHTYGPGEFKFMEAEKCSRCSLPCPVVWTGQMKRNFLWFSLELLFNILYLPGTQCLHLY